MKPRIVLLLAVTALSACTLGPDYRRPAFDLPESALGSTLLTRSQQQAIAYWWTRYRDPELNRLIDDALDDNLDIALQAARFREARAQLGLANANLFPTVQGQANATRQKSSRLGVSAGGGSASGSGAGSGGANAGGGDVGGTGSGGAGAGASTRYNFFSVAASLNYELDVFGGLRRADEAARAQLLSSAYTKDSVRLSVVADVVSNYMSLLATERQIRVTQQTIDTRKKGLSLDNRRYQYGAIDKLTLLQTRSLLETARAQLPPLQQQARQLRTSLAILTGRTPAGIMKTGEISDATFDDVRLPQDLPVVLPSTLLERRPDIRAAEASLIAANANVGVAKARFFPTFNLTAMIGTEALEVGDLFGSGTETQSIGGAITAPILDFGRRQAQYDTARARKDAAEIMYRQTVRQAFQDVRNALDAVQFSDARYAAVLKQVDAYRESLRLAKLRYRVGRTAFFDVLDAQRQLFSSQLSLANAIRDRFTAVADLFKALGGGWTENSDSLTPGLRATQAEYDKASASHGDDPDASAAHSN